jgi:hypothetical protein
MEKRLYKERIEKHSLYLEDALEHLQQVTYKNVL